MAQRGSGYERREGDNYATPDWCVGALLDFIELRGNVWEAAPGDGYMCRSLRKRGHNVVRLHRRADFLRCPLQLGCSIVTNPPFKLADEFIEHALELTERKRGIVCMLLPLGFDSAKSRRPIFEDCPHHRMQIVMTKRIRWANIVQKEAGPSTVHCWQVWDWRHRGASTKRWFYE